MSPENKSERTEVLSIGNSEKVILDPSGGSIFTRKLIFGRPDLLEQCPREVQESIRLMHHAITLQSKGCHEKGREYLQMTFESLDRPKILD